MLSRTHTGIAFSVGVLLSACFTDPYEVIVIGSCIDEGNPAFLEFARCTERVEERQDRPSVKDVCEDNFGTWTDEPCDRATACGCCEEGDGGQGSRTVCTYPTEGLSIRDEQLQLLCEEDSPNTWVDNPDVSCE